MNSIAIGEFGCDKVKPLSDAFIDRELCRELQSQVLRHILRCNYCAVFIDQRIGLKRMVRASVTGMTVPTTLLQRVRARIQV